MIKSIAIQSQFRQQYSTESARIIHGHVSRHQPAIFSLTVTKWEPSHKSKHGEKQAYLFIIYSRQSRV